MQTKQIASLFPLTGAVFSCRSPENTKRSGNIDVLIRSGSYENRKPPALCQLAQSPEALGHSLPGLHRREDLNNPFTSINIISMCLFLKAVLEATLDLNAFHFLIYFLGLQNYRQAHANV